MLHVSANAFGHHLAAALGRPPTDDELTFAEALTRLDRTEGVSLLRIDAVKARTGLGRSSIYALAAENRFPKPIQLDGSRVSVWSSADIDRWIAQQIQNREG